MRALRKFLLICLVLASLASYHCWADRRQTSNASLTSDQLQVYGDFIKSLSKMNFKYLSNETFPLQLSSLGKETPCLQGVSLDSAAESNMTVHRLNQEVLQGHSINLVGKQEESSILKHRDADSAKAPSNSDKDGSGTTTDPGILALSEIVFDRSHHFAVVKYVFLCGSRCNSGAILVLEKVGSQWTGTTRRPCSFVLNNDNPRQ
jgi:hypothetical protein